LGNLPQSHELKQFAKATAWYRRYADRLLALHDRLISGSYGLF